MKSRLYQPVPKYGRRPSTPEIFAENGNATPQSCGRRTRCHAEASKSAASAPFGSGVAWKRANAHPVSSHFPVARGAADSTAAPAKSAATATSPTITYRVISAPSLASAYQR